MIRILLPLIGLLLLAFSSLTVFRVPVAVNWRLALLAGEFGYALWLLPAALALVALAVRPAGAGVPWFTLVTSLLAVVLLLKPSWQAWRIGADLAGRVQQELGATPPARPAFTVAGLMPARIPKVPVETHRVGPDLPFDFYRPARPVPGGAPCVIVIHGGGWDSGDRAQLPDFNHGLAARGYAVAAISYRLAPAHPWPAQRDDTLAAIAYLKTHAAALGIAADRLVLLGRSAGGQIAAAVGYGADDPAICGVVALYAPHDLRFVWSISRDDDALNSLKLMRQYLGGPPEGREELYDTASAQRLIRAGRTPPTLLIHGEVDTLVWHRHSERLAEGLRAQGVPHLFLSLPWAVHAVEYNPAGPAGQLTGYALEAFLARVTAR